MTPPDRDQQVGKAVEDFKAALKAQGHVVTHPDESVAIALQAAAPSIRQQERERVEAALLSTDVIVAAVEGHGGSVIPHEESMMRDAFGAALATLDQEDH